MNFVIRRTWKKKAQETKPWSNSTSGASKSCGRPRGNGRVLSAAQEAALQRIIIDKRPEQLKIDFFLWSRAAVGQFIEQEYGIKLPVRSVGKYLARWGFTPQRPIKRAYEQNPAAVQAWLQGEYPGIDQRATREGAEIHWGDESDMQLKTSSSRINR